MPTLSILAGPNGAGKTRCSDLLQKIGLLPVKPIDLDLLFNEAIASLPQSIYGADQRISKVIDKLFRDYCNDAIDKNLDFCYECNLRKDQLIHVSLFENAGYTLNLIYFTLNSIEQSQQRVNFRYYNENGRLVNIESIRENFIQGIHNLDNHYMDFDQVIIVDNSEDNYEDNLHNLNIKVIFQKPNIQRFAKDFPSQALEPYLPQIIKHIQNSN